MSNNFKIIKQILDTDEADKIRATVENFQLVEMPDEIVEFATAASALKQTILGDINLVSVEEVLNLTRGDISGRIQR